MNDNKNIFILGGAGAGKTHLVTDKLNNTDLKNKVVFVIGQMECAKLTGALSAKNFTVISKAVAHPHDARDCSDLELYGSLKKQYPHDEFLVVVDECCSPSASLIERITQDVYDRNCELWLCVQAFYQFIDTWNANLIKAFTEFYFFNSRFNEKFLNESTIEKIESFPRSRSPFLFYPAGTPVSDFLSEKFIDLLRRDFAHSMSSKFEGIF